MPDVSIANLPAFLGPKPADADIVPFTNVGDTTESPLGTTKRMTVAQLFASPTFTGSLTINGNLTVNGLTTLTGALVGSSANFSGAVNVQSLGVSGALNADGLVRVNPGPLVVGPTDPGGTEVFRVGGRGKFADTLFVNGTGGGGPLYLTNTSAAGPGNVYINFVRGATVSGYMFADAADNLVFARGDGGAAVSIDRVSGIVTLSQELVLGNLTTFVPGMIATYGPYGLVLQLKTGTTYDFAMLNPAASGLIMSVATGTVTMTFGGSVSAAGSVSAPVFVITGTLAGIIAPSIYTQVRSPDGVDGLLLGNPSDPNNYYSNSGHIFRSRDGSVVYANINSSGIQVPNIQSIVTSVQPSSTLSKYFQLNNNNNNSIWGIEGASGGTMLSGSSPYALVWGTVNGTNVEFFTNNTRRLTIGGTSGAIVASGSVQAVSMQVRAAGNLILSYYNDAAVANQKAWLLLGQTDGTLGFYAYDDSVSAGTPVLTFGRAGTAPRLGFFNGTPIVKPAVGGSRGGNAALASLLSWLATYGLITDSTTA